MKNTFPSFYQFFHRVAKRVYGFEVMRLIGSGLFATIESREGWAVRNNETDMWWSEMKWVEKKITVIKLQKKRFSMIKKKNIPDPKRAAIFHLELVWDRDEKWKSGGFEAEIVCCSEHRKANPNSHKTRGEKKLCKSPFTPMHIQKRHAYTLTHTCEPTQHRPAM